MISMVFCLAAGRPRPVAAKGSWLRAEDLYTHVVDDKASIVLREATPEDAEAVAGLCAQLGYSASVADVRQRLATGTGGIERAVTLACEGDVVVGWIEVQVACTIESGSWAEITGLVVDRACRRRGVGAGLVRWVKEWAREHGQKRLRVRSNVARQDSSAFYGGLGFAQAKQQRVFDLHI